MNYAHPKTKQLETVTNYAGTTFKIGERVKKEGEGWYGTIIKIEQNYHFGVLLFVNPDNIEEVKYGCWPLNPIAAKETGKTHFCRPRDHGMSMGNFIHAS